jgi:PAS domain S-box-containing protein
MVLPMLNDSDAEVHGDKPSAETRAVADDRLELSTVAFQRTRMPMVMTDARQPDNPIVLANKAFLDLTGYTAEEVLGKNCRFLQGASTSRSAIAEIRAALAEGREVNIELLNYRKDGAAFWNQLHISPIQDDDGRTAYHFASQIDVTEYRKVQTLEASEHRLLMEVDHRAKNVLAVVTSFVRLSRSDDAAQYAASVQQRIQALSQAHVMLAESGWNEIPLEEIVKGQLLRYGRRNVELEGPDVPISPLDVQPLTLIIHELATNAAVHGALSAAAGKLRIQWQSIGTCGGFRMIWRETGSKAPTSDPKKGFGTLMAGAMVEKQLSGRMNRDWLEDGLQIVLEIPASSEPSPS